jgi:REP element-mobilizing transposase RayT
VVPLQSDSTDAEVSQDAVRVFSRSAKLRSVARPLRLEHAGAIWHVTSRGNAQQAIVADDTDRARFVEILGRVVPTVSWRLHAWVLMTNHYHLLVETTEPTLARGMRQINGIYAQAFNQRKRVRSLKRRKGESASKGVKAPAQGGDAPSATAQMQKCHKTPCGCSLGGPCSGSWHVPSGWSTPARSGM